MWKQLRKQVRALTFTLMEHRLVFPLCICAKCEHIAQWVMMCTHTGCSELWLVPFHFHRLRAVSAFAQVPFPPSENLRDASIISTLMFLPLFLISVWWFSYGARFCFSVSQCHIYCPSPVCHQRGFLSEWNCSKELPPQTTPSLPTRTQIVALAWQQEESEPFTLGDSVGPGIDSVALSVDKESVRGSWDLNFRAKLLLFLPLSVRVEPQQEVTRSSNNNCWSIDLIINVIVLSQYLFCYILCYSSIIVLYISLEV